jgi:S-adenosylmethionine decarboxylase proenzyme
MDTRGRHVILDFWQCEAGLLRDPEGLLETLREAARSAGVQPLNSMSHCYPGDGGVTAIVLVEGSHLSIRTCPEHQYAAVDIYTCGNGLPGQAIPYLRETLQADHFSLAILDRGDRELPDQQQVSIRVAEIARES